MKIYLVRHAQSEGNVGKLGGDFVLTGVGKEQAKRLGVYFKKAKVDLIFCSRLKRAKETLQYIIPYLKGKKVVYTKKINEHNLGNDYAKLRHTSDYEKLAKKSGKDFYDFKPRKGESYNELFKRVESFYKVLMKNKSKNVLVVGHGHFHKFLIIKILGLDISEEKYFKLSNASVSTFNIDKSCKVKEFHVNDFNHILEEGIKKNGKK